MVGSSAFSLSSRSSLRDPPWKATPNRPPSSPLLAFRARAPAIRTIAPGANLALADKLAERLGDRLQLFLGEDGARVDIAAEIARLDPQGELCLRSDRDVRSGQTVLARDGTLGGPLAFRNMRQQRFLAGSDVRQPLSPDRRCRRFGRQEEGFALRKGEANAGRPPWPARP